MLSIMTSKSTHACLQEDAGKDVEALAFTMLVATIRQVDSLKRYQGLRASLHLLHVQVTQLLSHLSGRRTHSLFMTACEDGIGWIRVFQARLQQRDFDVDTGKEVQQADPGKCSGSDQKAGWDDFPPEQAIA